MQKNEDTNIWPGDDKSACFSGLKNIDASIYNDVKGKDVQMNKIANEYIKRGDNKKATVCLQEAIDFSIKGDYSDIWIDMLKMELKEVENKE